ncbi:MAG TPA: 8-amino-7-oxononanoate synthase [Bacillota bacterium]|nr:8-amino-7-oxononanoate synthase [Bacillota bacterium]
MIEELSHLEEISQRRFLVKIEDGESEWLSKNGQKLLNLSSNNYLGLAGDMRLRIAGVEAINRYGCGAGASRLVVGNHRVYEEAELALKGWKGTEAGLILNSGYAANVGIISSVVGRNGIVYSDKLNHASIVDGILLSRAEHKRYNHCDLNHLESLLQSSPKHKRKLIVTDTVFSMDGDIAPLVDLVTLKERYNAILMVDEAHSSGIFGTKGEGLVHHFQLQDKVDIQMGTFSKALGCYGAYVVGSQWLIDYLMNKMRSFIFTTALPPAILGSACAAMQLVQTEHDRREKLLKNSEYFRTTLARFGFRIGETQTQIIPIIIGPNERTLQFSQRLQEEGIAAVAIRPPTVPDHQARIRFTVMATHTRNELAGAMEKIVKVGKETGVIG